MNIYVYIYIYIYIYININDYTDVYSQRNSICRPFLVKLYRNNFPVKSAHYSIHYSVYIYTEMQIHI